MAVGGEAAEAVAENAFTRRQRIKRFGRRLRDAIHVGQHDDVVLREIGRLQLVFVDDRHLVAAELRAFRLERHRQQKRFVLVRVRRLLPVHDEHTK